MRLSTASLGACLFSLLCLSSCFQPTSNGRPKATLANPEEYFRDDNAVRICQAISENDIQKIMSLAEGAATTVGDKGMSVLLWALLENNVEAVEIVLQHGADPNLLVEDDFDARSKGVFRGVAPIHIAAGMENPKFLELLLEEGGDPNLVGVGVSKETPLFQMLNRVKNIEKHLDLLIKHGVNLDHLAHGVTGAMWSAIANGRYDHSLQLLDSGANPKATAANGDTRLIHYLFRKPVASRDHSPDQEMQFRSLLTWLEKHGESVERAKADIASGGY